MEQMSTTEENKKINQQQELERLEIEGRMSQIKHKILVFSGKGGVGKSTVATNLAIALFQTGKSVGLLDVDIHGPSIPKMLNLEGKRVSGTQNAMIPVEVFRNFKVMSIGFLLGNNDDAVIMRGPLKFHTIRQFLKDVEWGDLDYLVIDSPPGTGDEPLTVAQSIENPDGAVIVTTPQQVAISDVRKSVTFCRKVNLPIIGVVENMSGFVCPYCNRCIDIFSSGGGEKMAEEMNIPFLGKIPIDPKVVSSGDKGIPYTQNHQNSQTAMAFRDAIKLITGMTVPGKTGPVHWKSADGLFPNEN
jgi:Mrp family chromosome partitioning ATPase